MLATMLNPPNLSAPISWKGTDPDLGAFLDNLQGNILKGHGRTNVVYLFCCFRPDRHTEALAFLRSQVARVHSAKDQLLAAECFRERGEKDLRPFVSVLLSKSGYDYFGVAANKQPPSAAFQGGMAAAGGRLGDPPPAEWAKRLRNPHLLLMVAVNSPAEAQTEATNLLSAISTIGDVASGQSGEIIGNQFFNTAGHGVENFGYVDGRSQPLVLTEDIPFEGGINKWPVTEFPVAQFVVHDPAAAGDPTAFGSYFVFRKLEQDVLGFKTREDELTGGRDKTFLNRDSAGVGRLESGTPFELSQDDHGFPDITNNFTYGEDPPRCPHFAHIRKVNPRTPETRDHLMIRRGITYGTRDDASPDPNDPTKLVLADDVDLEKMPTGGVGLLFQSYQADIANQFEVTQGWANSSGDGGVDPVIGQTKSALLDWPRFFASKETDKVEFYSRQGQAPAGPYVKLLGGGYFFAPSLPFLRSL